MPSPLIFWKGETIDGFEEEEASQDRLLNGQNGGKVSERRQSSKKKIRLERGKKLDVQGGGKMSFTFLTRKHLLRGLERRNQSQGGGGFLLNSRRGRWGKPRHRVRWGGERSRSPRFKEGGRWQCPQKRGRGVLCHSLQEKRKGSTYRQKRKRKGELLKGLILSPQKSKISNTGSKGDA